MANRHLWSAAVLTAFGVVGVLEARRLALGTVAQPGPGFFPMCLAIALTLTAGGLIVQSLRGPAPATRPAMAAGGPRRVVASLIALFAYAPALVYLGFVVATFLLVVFLLRTIQPRSWVVAVGSAAAMAGLSHLVFRVWLGVQLPAGPWGF